MSVTDPSQTLLAFLGMVILTNGLPEAVIGGIAASAIAVPVKKAVEKYMKNKRKCCHSGDGTFFSMNTVCSLLIRIRFRQLY